MISIRDYLKAKQENQRNCVKKAAKCQSKNKTKNPNRNILLSYMDNLSQADGENRF